MGNLAAALTGCCPVNGSVSRTAMGEQYQARTQLASVVAGVSMLVLLLFGTGFVGYLPGAGPDRHYVSGPSGSYGVSPGGAAMEDQPHPSALSL